jgi:hypothetical protein
VLLAALVLVRGTPEVSSLRPGLACSAPVEWHAKLHSTMIAAFMQARGLPARDWQYPLGLAVWLLLTGPGRLSPAGQGAGPGSGLVACGAAPAG